MNLAAAFAESAQRRPEKVALFWGDTEFTYANLLAQSRAVAGQLIERFNVKPGDRVGLWLKNRPEFVTAFFGIINAGGVVVPINNFLKPDEVIFILADAGADVLISDVELGGHFGALEVARPGMKMFCTEEFSATANAVSNPQSAICNLQSDSDLAVIIY